MNVEGVFQSLVNLGATWVLWLLVALSVVGLAIIAERTIFFVRTRIGVEGLRLGVQRGVDAPRRESIERRLRASSSIQARIIAAAISSTLPAEAEERMTAEIQLQRLRAEKNLAFLGTLGNNAPFVGLLGTVVGIIGAFHELDASGGQLTAGLMAEIGEALVATAVGLIVALPAVAAFNLFQRVIAARIAQGEALTRDFIAQLHVDSLSSSFGERHTKEAS